MDQQVREFLCRALIGSEVRGWLAAVDALA
jgi:hypothetical protein